MSASEENPKKRARKGTEEDGEEDSASSEQEAPKERKYHRGKWTNEECEYMLGLMEAFKAGHLPLREGTTLRSFLSSMMKCKPKRISKKFEGISYNGRMVYQKSKEPISIQAAMLLRARLSELERRYLAAAAEQREGNESIDALLRQEPAFAHQETSAFASVLEHQTAAFASMPPDRATARLSESTLAGSVGLGGLGLGGAPKLETKPDENSMARLLGGQGLNTMTGALRSMDPAILNSATATAAAANATTNTSLLSAGLAASGDAAYRLLAQRQLGSQAELPEPASQSFRSDLQSHLREIEQQQKLASLSNTNAATTLAAMQLRERTLAAQLASSGSLSLASSLRSEVLPPVSAGLSAERLPSLPAGYPNDALGAVQHNLDLNRYVLQSPQDDATYFRQRLLPGVASTPNSADPHQTRLATAARAGLGTTDLSVSLPSPSPSTAGNLAEYLSRIQESEKYDGRNLKRAR